MEEKLFNEPQDKMLIAHDINDKKHTANAKLFKFRISVYGMLIENDRILLQKHPLGQKFNLPGGGIEIGEKIEEALTREFKEETGLSIIPTKLLQVKEDFFTWDGEYAHSILIFYNVEKPTGNIKPNDFDSSEVKWVNIKKMSEETIQKVHYEVLNQLPFETFVQ